MIRDQNFTTALSLHRALLAVQSRARKLRLRTETGIDPLVSNYIPVLLPHLPVAVDDLAKMLSLPVQQCRALIASFQKQGILREQLDTRHNRMFVDLAPSGQALVPAIIAADKNIEEALVGHLDTQARARLTELMACLNDNLATLPERALAGETDFVAEQKTLARASGMLGQDYLGSGFEIGAIHLMEHLLDLGGCSYRPTLKAWLPLPAGETERTIAELTKRGILSETQSPQGPASVAFQEQGEKTAQQARALCLTTLNVAIGRMGAEPALELAAALLSLA